MVRHKHAKRVTAPSGTALHGRIEKALAEHRSQQALELAKNLHRQENSSASKELLKKASLARVHDLSAQGKHQDASAILANLVTLDTTPEFLAEVAEQMADAGALDRVAELLARIGEPALQAKVMAHIADEVVRKGGSAREYLPPELHAPLDALLEAAAHAEKGDDAAAREKLHAIGLQSPFLEWKLFLRGLLAFYAQDNVRALENWQRLDPRRWPFRLAAPLRFAIDAEFARSQPPAAQAHLQQQSLRLVNSPLLLHLRAIQKSIVHENQLAQAFRTAEQALPQLRQEAPQLVPRLAAAFYWAIIHHGNPEDMKRYQRVFGMPADDPELARLEALALEVRGNLAEAHKHWQRFEKSVLKSDAWPDDQKDRVRAFVWARMGNNAENVPDMDIGMEPNFFAGPMRRPKPLKPGPVECFEKALQLAPDQLANYQALISHYQDEDDIAKTEQVARRLLQHFPKDAAGLELMGDLLMRQEKHGEALGYYQQALSVNPLEKQTRYKLANAHSYQARALAEEGRFDEARAAYQAAMSIDDRSEKYPVLCKWAACEFKAGQPDRAQELLGRAYAEKDSRLAVVFSMLIETIRFNLTKLKPQFNKEFNALLAEPPTGAAAAALAKTAAEHKLAGVNYRGQQTHEKKVRTYLERALHAPFTVEQLQKVCAALEVLKITRLLESYLKLGQKQFPADPFFFLAEAMHLLGPTGRGYGAWRASDLLTKARQLAEAMPRNPRQEELLRQIQNCEQLARELNPFGNGFPNIFGGMPFDPFGPMDEDEDEFDDDF